MVEFSGSLSGIEHILDTSSQRRAWWLDPASDLHPNRSDLAAALAESPMLMFDATRFGPAAPNACASAKPTTLTPREREVIQLSAEGLTSIEIAERLEISSRNGNQQVDKVADQLRRRNRATRLPKASVAD